MTSTLLYIIAYTCISAENKHENHQNIEVYEPKTD